MTWKALAKLVVKEAIFLCSFLPIYIISLPILLNCLKYISVSILDSALVHLMHLAVVFFLVLFFLNQSTIKSDSVSNLFKESAKWWQVVVIGLSSAQLYNTEKFGQDHTSTQKLNKIRLQIYNFGIPGI